jgi:hypothetical protein
MPDGAWPRRSRGAPTLRDLRQDALAEGRVVEPLGRDEEQVDLVPRVAEVIPSTGRSVTRGKLSAATGSRRGVLRSPHPLELLLPGLALIGTALVFGQKLLYSLM